MLACGLTPQPSASVISLAGPYRRSEIPASEQRRYNSRPSLRSQGFYPHLLNTSDCWADIFLRPRRPELASAVAEPHAGVEAAAPDARSGEPALAAQAEAAPDARSEEPALAAQAATEALALPPAVRGPPGVFPAWVAAGATRASPGFSSAPIPERWALYRGSQ